MLHLFFALFINGEGDNLQLPALHSLHRIAAALRTLAEQGIRRKGMTAVQTAAATFDLAHLKASAFCRGVAGSSVKTEDQRLDHHPGKLAGLKFDRGNPLAPGGLRLCQNKFDDV